MREYPHTAGKERLAALHDAADALVDELAEQYMVERRETKEALGSAEALVRVVRLIPRTPAAAPLAIAFTGLPGLRLRLGRWWTQDLPRWGDTENPEQLIEQLRTQAYALVEGGLWERVRRGVGGSRFETRLIGNGFRGGRDGSLSARAARDARRNGFAAAIQWAPWPRSPVEPDDLQRDPGGA